MRNNILLATCVAALALPLAACNDPKDTATVAQSYGPSPNLPPPEHSWIPTVDIASVNRWPDGAKPIAANGMTVTAFATGLEHPRTVYTLPNGDVLVAESNAPPKPDDGKGIKGFVYRQAQKWAGAGVPSANRITLLRDADGDGVAETRSIFLSGLEFAVRHGAGRRGFLCRQLRCDHEIPLSRPATPRSARPASSLRTCPPARSITTGPRTSPQARTVRSSM